MAPAAAQAPRGPVIDVHARTLAAPSRLGKVQVKRVPTPATYVIYGPEGIGKTTLAASAPGVIFMDIEDGSTELEVARYPFTDDPKRGHVPTTYQQVLDAIEDLTVSDHQFKALAIDSVDRLESLIWKYLLGRDSKQSAKNKTGEEMTSIEDYGYGKGYTMAVEEFRALAARLDRLRYAKNMEIILLGHAQVKSFKNPAGEDYDRWQLRMNVHAGAFLKEWAKVTGFMRLEETTTKKGTGKFARSMGVSTTVRVIELARSAAVDAKSRLALPPLVEVDADDPWAHFGAAVAAANDVDPEDLVKKIEVEFKRIGDEGRAKRARPVVQDALKKGDSGKLQRFLGELQKVPAAGEEVAS